MVCNYCVTTLISFSIKAKWHTSPNLKYIHIYIYMHIHMIFSFLASTVLLEIFRAFLLSESHAILKILQFLYLVSKSLWVWLLFLLIIKNSGGFLSLLVSIQLSLTSLCQKELITSWLLYTLSEPCMWKDY